MRHPTQYMVWSMQHRPRIMATAVYASLIITFSSFSLLLLVESSRELGDLMAFGGKTPSKPVAFIGENFVPTLSSQGIMINGRWNTLYKMSWENKAVHRWPGAFLAVSKSVNTL